MAMTQATMDLFKESLKTGSTLAKAGFTSSSLPNFDLQRPAKTLVPVNTPLRNFIPRVPGNGDTATRWKTILAYDTGLMLPGISEGNRAANLTPQIGSVTSQYYGLGHESYVTYEGDFAAEGFDDLRMRSTEAVLRNLMVMEERAIVGGNSTLLLGTPATPTLAAVTKTSTFGNSTQSVIVVALTLDGYIRATVAGGVKTTLSQVSAGAYSNTDVHGGGSSQKSAAATQAITGTTQSLSMSTTAIAGAVAYAWYWGTAGSEVLGAITTVNSNTASAAAAGTQNASAITADNSEDGFVFDGLLTQIAKNSTSSYFKSLDGAALTGDGAGNVVEILAALKSFWDGYQLTPTDVWVNSQEYTSITKLVGVGTGPYRVNVAQGDTLNVGGGMIVKELANPYDMTGGRMLQIHIHPHIPPGTMIFTSSSIPYQFTNVGAPLEMKMRRDYYSIEWPLIKRQYEMGCYVDETLAMYVPFAFGAISNIKAS